MSDPFHLNELTAEERKRLAEYGPCASCGWPLEVLTEVRIEGGGSMRISRCTCRRCFPHITNTMRMKT